MVVFLLAAVTWITMGFVKWPERERPSGALSLARLGCQGPHHLLFQIPRQSRQIGQSLQFGTHQGLAGRILV